MNKTRIVTGIIGWSILFLFPLAAPGTTFTLSDSALMSLDYPYPYDLAATASMLSIVDVAGPGVQFDILFPDPLDKQGQVPALEWTSCIYGGNGALTGIDISSYDSFALKFTLVSTEGVSSPDAVGPVIVGAMINHLDYLSAFKPEVIEINDLYNPVSATSVTTSDASQIELIGFTCYIPYWWYDPEGPLGSSPWDPDGAIVSLLVEPAPDSVTITPEPASVLLLAVGVAFIRRKF